MKVVILASVFLFVSGCSDIDDLSVDKHEADSGSINQDTNNQNPPDTEQENELNGDHGVNPNVSNEDDAVDGNEDDAVGSNEDDAVDGNEGDAVGSNEDDAVDGNEGDAVGSNEDDAVDGNEGENTNVNYEDITLHWTTPSVDVDLNSILPQEIESYIINWGDSETDLSHFVEVDSLNSNTYIFPDMASGTYYFSIKVKTIYNEVSDISNIVSKQIE